MIAEDRKEYIAYTYQRNQSTLICRWSSGSMQSVANRAENQIGQQLNHWRADYPSIRNKI